MKKRISLRHRRSLWLEELEPRLLFSAGLESVLLEEDLSAMSPLSYGVVSQDIDEINSSSTDNVVATDVPVRRELIIFDSRVADY